MDNQKVLEEILFEYNLKVRGMENDFGNKVSDFEDGDWTETELMAYDLGFAKALSIVIDILKENGVE